jgi:hypothetical protein
MTYDASEKCLRCSYHSGHKNDAQAADTWATLRGRQFAHIPIVEVSHDEDFQATARSKGRPGTRAGKRMDLV